jgi:hypothetical protein
MGGSYSGKSDGGDRRLPEKVAELAFADAQIRKLLFCASIISAPVLADGDPQGKLLRRNGVDETPIGGSARK